MHNDNLEYKIDKLEKAVQDLRLEIAQLRMQQPIYIPTPYIPPQIPYSPYSPYNPYNPYALFLWGNWESASVPATNKQENK